MLGKFSYKRYTEVKFTAILAITLLSPFLMTNSLNQVFAGSPYDSGHNHGCSDAGLPNSDRYINQPEKGPSYHTSDFMNGYYAGLNSCSSSNSASYNENFDGSGKESNQLMCYAAGGLAVLSGAPIETVIGAGQAAHQVGICP